jgi:hypothetical protein
MKGGGGLFLVIQNQCKCNANNRRRVSFENLTFNAKFSRFHKKSNN